LERTMRKGILSRSRIKTGATRGGKHQNNKENVWHLSRNKVYYFQGGRIIL